jgi:hypothetical protein
MKFYPADWRADAMLRLCSIGARGLWAEMMCIMHDAEPYGSLLVNGRRIDKKQLAALSGISEKECSVLLFELEGNGVFSRDEDGTIFSRRMRRDHQKAVRDKANGSGGGNPRLKEGVNPQDKWEDKAQKPEARSQKPEKKDTREGALFAAMEAFWSIWPNKVGKPAALKALRSAIDRATISDICAGVESYIRCKPPDRPWLNPATFLNQNRWEDQPAPTTLGPKNGPSQQISTACDGLIDKLNAGFGGATSQEHSSGGTHEIDARLLAYGRG